LRLQWDAGQELTLASSLPSTWPCCPSREAPLPLTSGMGAARAPGPCLGESWATAGGTAGEGSATVGGAMAVTPSGAPWPWPSPPSTELLGVTPGPATLCTLGSLLSALTPHAPPSSRSPARASPPATGPGCAPRTGPWRGGQGLLGGASGAGAGCGMRVVVPGECGQGRVLGGGRLGGQRREGRVRAHR